MREAMMPNGQAQPTWITNGLKDLGFHETGNNQGIEKFIAQAHCGALGGGSPSP